MGLVKMPCMAQAGLKPEQMRAQLGRFGLSGHHHLQPICKLSGGQKARVVFTSISLGNPHILLLDEPTNHLDMQSIDALSDALAEARAATLFRVLQARQWSAVIMQSSLHGNLGSMLTDVFKKCTGTATQVQTKVQV